MVSTMANSTFRGFSLHSIPGISVPLIITQDIHGHKSAGLRSRTFVYPTSKRSK